jgi:hypothetical protein
MKTWKIFVVVLVFGIIAIFGSEIGERLAVPGVQDLVSSADARVGRPLTPVSVAGVARRTVRRCAVGVYCSLPGSQVLADLLWKATSEPIHFEKHSFFDTDGPENG